MAVEGRENCRRRRRVGEQRQQGNEYAGARAKVRRVEIEQPWAGR